MRNRQLMTLGRLGSLFTQADFGRFSPTEPGASFRVSSIVEKWWRTGFYSSRSEATGSRRLARRAGIHAAIAQTTASVATAATIAAGWLGCTSYSKLAISLEDAATMA